MRILIAISLCIILQTQVSAQVHPRLKAHAERVYSAEKSLTNQLPLRSIGPSIYSCRVTDLDVNPSDPTEFYVAYASGGLWHTTNNGQSFQPIFDREASMTIGDIAVHWPSRTIWVGTGEANSSRSSYAGVGVYKSTNNGKTWNFLGLPESHHIGRVLVHPRDSNIAWVGVLGHLYTKNAERGVFLTTDGGANWTHTLAINDSTGIIDMQLDPLDSKVVFAAAWERTRTAWHFEGAGAGSGMYKSIDGGLTWKLMSGDASGFPGGAKIGRIGLTAGVRNGKTILYASLDNQNPKPKKDKKVEEGITKDTLRSMTEAVFLAWPKAEKKDFLSKNEFPEKYTVEVVDSLVKYDSLITPASLVQYLEDANNNLFETDYIGAEVYTSEDGGATWKKTHGDPIEQMHFTYGYYFSNIRCDEKNANRVYLLGFYIIASEDGGNTWKLINQENVHVDHHALWVNTQKAGHIINGNDGGLNMSYDNGTTWSKLNSPPVGQLYTIHADMADPYNVYLGNQDNGVWVGPSDYKANLEWHQSGKYPYQEIMGGDGMQIQVDTRDNRTVYTGYQFGNYFRIDRYSGRTKAITPRHELGERPLRFNWQTPIHLSNHNQDILYLGANKVYRTMDKGETWTALSEDLTNGGRAGNVPFGTITALHESKLRFGLLYAGTDDGNVWVSKDCGTTWQSIKDGLPEGMWVSRIQASVHKLERVYLSLNGYRNDVFESWCYQSDDYGKHWQRIGTDIPAEPVNVIKEDPVKANLIYVGTDHQLYVSLNFGKQFQVLTDSLPYVPVHDLDFHEPSATLLIGTHGRSAYAVSTTYLHQLHQDSLNQTFMVLSVGKLKHSKSWGKKIAWQEPRTPKLPVSLYLRDAGMLDYTLEHETGLMVQKGSIKTVRGVNQVEILMSHMPEVRNKLEKALNKSLSKEDKLNVLEVAEDGNWYLPKAKYKLKFSNGAECSFEIE